MRMLRLEGVGILGGWILLGAMGGRVEACDLAFLPGLPALLLRACVTRHLRCQLAVHAPRRVGVVAGLRVR
jgi:hypothetical protein